MYQTLRIFYVPPPPNPVPAASAAVPLIWNAGALNGLSRYDCLYPRRLALVMAPGQTSTISPSAGFHPILSTEIAQLRPLGPSCSLHLLYALGSDLILDQYQIRQLHSEGHLVYSKRSSDDDGNVDGKHKGKGKSIQAELYLGGQLDLEAPVSQVDPAKQAYALISIPSASSSSASNLPPGYEVPAVDVAVELPLHVRYQEPVLSRYLSREGRQGYGGRWYIKHTLPEDRQDTANVTIDWPCVFWACETEQPAATEGTLDRTCIPFMKYRTDRPSHLNYSFVTLQINGRFIVLYRTTPTRIALLASDLFPSASHYNTSVSLPSSLRFRFVCFLSAWKVRSHCTYGRSRRSQSRDSGQCHRHVVGIHDSSKEGYRQSEKHEEEGDCRACASRDGREAEESYLELRSKKIYTVSAFFPFGRKSTFIFPKAVIIHLPNQP